MLFSKLRSIFFLIPVVFLLVPAVSEAQGLVPCGLTANLFDQCQLCDVITLITNIIKFLIIDVAAPVATLLIAWAGIKLIVFGDSDGERTEAKQLLKDVIVGFMIVLFAWTVVQMILAALVNPKEGGAWFKIQCTGRQAVNLDIRSVFIGGTLTNTPTTTTSASCTNCNRMESSIPVKPGIACQTSSTGCILNNEVSLKLNSFKDQLDSKGIKWQMTEGYPPTGYSPSTPAGIHTGICHSNGTCIDANFTGQSSPTVANIRNFSEAAATAGLRAEYEVKTQAEADALKAQLPASVIVKAIPQITAPHFSLYNVRR